MHWFVAGIGLIALVVLIGFSIGAIASGRRSLVSAVLAILLALFSSLVAWYAWAESGSEPWTIGYESYFILRVPMVSSSLPRRVCPREGGGQEPCEWQWHGAMTGIPPAQE